MCAVPDDGCVKAEQRMNQSRLAGAIRPQQTNRAAAQLSVQFAQDWPATERDRKTLQINNRGFAVRSLPGSAGILPARSLQIIGRSFGVRSLRGCVRCGVVCHSS